MMTTVSALLMHTLIFLSKSWMTSSTILYVSLIADILHIFNFKTLVYMFVYPKSFVVQSVLKCTHGSGQCLQMAFDPWKCFRKFG